MHQPYTTVVITKADGTEELFDVDKLRHSLVRSGASNSATETVISHIEQELVPGMTTGDIYRKAFALLKKIDKRPVASRYSLKRAILDFGPTGYPFEDYVAEIFRADGWHAQTRRTLAGICTTHEVDLFAERDGHRIGGEVKFHNQPGLRSDVKTALYVKSRWDDLNNAAIARGELPFEKWYLITNTHFTAQAIEYGTCAGLSLIAWDYPNEGSLQDRIEAANLHPLTCLTTLTGSDKRHLMEESMVLCRSIVENPGALRKIGLGDRKIDRVVTESKYLCTV
jgi:hypothetical protein